MKKLIVLMLVAMVGIGLSCSNAVQKDKEAIVQIKTEFGDIKLKLYSDTPEHKKNFLKLIDEGFYDGLLFHRVIENFMIQGGDPDSKNAEAGKRLGGGTPRYTVPAEFVPVHFHKKGALAAARKGGPSNPEKRSSGSQFYIVQGEVFSGGKLDTLETVINGRVKKQLMKEKFTAATQELNEFRNNNDQVGFNVRVAELRAEVDSIYEAREPFTFTQEQREAYTTVGGYPSLDGEYTVFGEVIEGLDILDKIAAVETDRYNRPNSDIKMEIEVVK